VNYYRNKNRKMTTVQVENLNADISEREQGRKNTRGQEDSSFSS
jgi:hypothetical protein